MYIAGNIDVLTHKALHGLLVTILGAVSNLEDPERYLGRSYCHCGCRDGG
jgi:hypothetical protein